MRLHGPLAEAYHDSHASATLTAWAERIRAWHREMRAVYVYFDNDEVGFAVQNALEVKRLIALGGQPA